MSKLAKAKEIESNLESMAAEQKANPKRKRDDEKSQALRLQLCSVLSDVILLDCMLADSSDATGRLWKNCFYGRINDMRSRIMKEKSRAKKRAAAGASNEADTAKKMVGVYEQQLKTFLQEAIQLYKYLIERYLKELMPLSQSQASSASEQQLEEERAHVVVSSLYKMNIHLGDLYRYSASYKDAAGCYTRAAKLAPGTGNPFNQLAVVAQQSQDAHDTQSQTAIALYYYARSLMASRQPFETSRSNLVRLFESNRKWMEEHSRNDDAQSRGIINVGIAENKAGLSKKAHKEWMQKERTAVNRKALSRFVDLQWAFFRGVSLDGDKDDKIDLDGLVKKMNSLHETYSNLVGNASLGESLLCKLIAVLAFSTLGASNGGKLMNAEVGFDAKRAKDPKWNEGIVMTNQALAFSFVLRFCTVLAKDVDSMIAKKMSADSANKLGAIRSISPLLLGFRFVTSLYEGSNDWFHGIPFFPSGVGAAGNELDSSAIHKLCKKSHVEFWKSVASLANRFDDLPKKKNNGAQKEELNDLTDIKDFEEFHGYVPFASFMDKTSDATVLVQSSKQKKYATADEAIYALSDTKHSGSGQGNEAETKLKINLFLAMADGKTSPSDDSDKDGQYFLSRNPETHNREFIAAETKGEKEASEPEQENASPDQSPNFTDMDVEDTKTSVEDAVPLKMSYSEKGMALLTPAALLAGERATEQPLLNGAPVNNEAKKPTLLSPIDSILAPTNVEPPTNLNTAASKGVDLYSMILNNSFPTKQPEPPKAPLPPPPGFSMQPQPELPQLPLAPTTTTGISLADFTAPLPAQQNVAFGTNQAPPGMMPQAGPTYPASNMFQTMNPFFQQAPSPFNNDMFAPTHYSSGLNQPPPPGLLNAAHGVNLQQPSINGLDPTLDFLLNSNRIQTPDDLASSNAFNLLVPNTAEPNDPSESILNFLFDSNDSSRAGQPLYASQHHPSQSQHGMPQTKNPFAT